MPKELQITIGREDCGCYSLATKGHKTRYPLDGITLIQIIGKWIKQGLDCGLTKDDWKELGGDEGKVEVHDKKG